MKKHIKHHGITVVVVLAVLALGAGAFVYSGLYNIGADDHHTKLVHSALQTLRDRSIHMRSQDIKVPDLEDPQLILKGAGQYAAMCTQCHLTPGQTDSEIRPGLYPQPPNLAQERVDPKDAFWVIKHGIKMSAMPAWGLSHEDPAIWSMVAFLQKLPDMTAAQYKDIVDRAPPDEDMDMGGDGGHSHSHGHGDGAPAAPGMQDMPGMPAHSDGAATDTDDHHAAAAPAAAAPLSFDGMKPGAAPEAEAVAKSFQQALQRGDRDAVLALLSPEATISESGQTQSREAYAADHLSGDIAFLKSSSVTPLSMVSMPMGGTAMVGSESMIAIHARTQPSAVSSRELLTLKIRGRQWKISSVQSQSEEQNASH
jgi:ketosteroid isomerase-like protein